MDEILQIKDLTKKYGDFKLDQVSFSIPKGSIMGLIGEHALWMDGLHPAKCLL